MKLICFCVSFSTRYQQTCQDECEESLRSCALHGARVWYVSIASFMVIHNRLLGEEKLSQAADVYAFGICALEVHTLI